MYNDLFIKDIINLWLNDEKMPLRFIYRGRIFKKQKTIDLCTMYKCDDGSYFDFGLYLNKHEYVTCKIKDILDETERKYLKDVITPFRNRVRYIIKQKYYEYEYISIEYKEIGNSTYYIQLPNFKSNNMYKGMKIGKQYTLNELDL